MKYLALIAAVVALMLALALPWTARAADLSPPAARAAMANGNYKDAYDALAPKVTAAAGTDQLAADFQVCVNALNNLGRVDEVDGFMEKAVAAHPADWRLLQTAARNYRDQQHFGTIISGVFHRGQNRNGDGKWVNALDRDRVRSLQLLRQTVDALQKDKAAAVGEAAAVYYQLAESLLYSLNGPDAWRLQTLTDLTTLPDYEETPGPYYYGRNYQGARGAPLDDAGNPIFHRLPKGGWDTAATDGERWRWALMQASELSVDEAFHAQLMFAQFLQRQFGVETMADFARVLGAGPGEDGKKDESGPFAVSTLKDGETIARLANGIRRFALPDEFNPLKIYQAVANDPRAGGFAAQATDALAQAYENRQQYNTAADWWQKGINRFGDQSFRQARLDQIVKNWGMFEDTLTQPAGGDGAKVALRFRNGQKVSFVAREIDVKTLLDDVKAYIRTRPNQLDWQRIDLNLVGYRLVTLNQAKYVGRQAAAWDLALQPRPDHFDRRVLVDTPLKAAGAYLLTATMAGGNTTSVVVWVADTVIVSKPLDGAVLTYVADAATGAPVAGATVDHFGYRQVYLENNRYRLDVQTRAATTDADGQARLAIDPSTNNDPLPEEPNAAGPAADNMSWLTTATTKDGRLAYMGFVGIWRGVYTDQYDYEYNRTKSFVMTDRPVYRPAQKVQFKMWVGDNKYDREGANPHAGQAATIEIRNPRGEMVKSVSGTLDTYGGLAGELDLDKSTPLGVYSVHNPDGTGATQFRVEEYKKPEFEVKIDAPTEPVMLGERVPATITAKYYFGSPVTNATVKYKVTRTTHDARWYPVGRWDWFYEPGYWWFGHDYLWYPGFIRWGCFAPIRHWWPGGWSNEQPEVVFENEVPVGADGTVKVTIDTAVAKAAYGDRDHKYTLTAEVTDASRRTITGTGDVLVARDPFKVYAWVDRGHYRVGDTVHAYFRAQTLAEKPVKGAGALKLLRVTYNAAGKPTETEVQHWDLPTGEEGSADVQVKADRAGQYRLSYTVTDSANHAIEGGYLFVVRAESGTATAAEAGREFRFNDVEVTTDKAEYKAGEKVRLLVAADRADATVLLFVRPANGVYLPPKVIRMKGKTATEEVEVGKKDMPNFFVEAMTVADARVFTDVREVIVPPEDRVLNVAVSADAAEYKPGQKATLTVKVTEKNGEPFTGSAVLSLYDKAVEYISGGPNVADIRKYFWQWRRTHYVHGPTSLEKYGGQVGKRGEPAMEYLGVFGALTTELADTEGLVRGTDQMKAIDGLAQSSRMRGSRTMSFGGGGGLGGRRAELAADVAAGPLPASAPMASMAAKEEARDMEAGSPAGVPGAEPSVRTNFADTALWAPQLVTATNGTATVSVTMPENLTTWKARVWTFGNGSRVGQADAEVVTRKNLIVRLEAPRFFVQNDEVVISAIVHNYLKADKGVRVSLDLEGGTLQLLKLGAGPFDPNEVVDRPAPNYLEVNVPKDGEKRVDWRVRVQKEGVATVRIKAVTDEESDATQMTFPAYVHGMLKTDSFAGALRPEGTAPAATLTGLVKLAVPAERRPEQTRLEVRYSPSLAAAMVDALPYMVDFPYGCTEQTLNRFVPTVITQQVLKDMKLDLAAIRAKRTNLNAQEVGDAAGRAADWGRRATVGFAAPVQKNPVFDPEEVTAMVREGVSKLTSMQLSDGGWGWFSGYGEQSWPHTTAVVVHGLQVARENGATFDPGVTDRGIAWLRNYQVRQLELLKNWDLHHGDPAWRGPMKQFADDVDAFVFMVLTDAPGAGPTPPDNTMRDYLFRDRTHLSVYTKAMYGLALHKLQDAAKLQVILENCRQFLVQDDENQTAYLKLPPDSWYYWWGSETEAHAYYLKLLAKTDPKGRDASRLAKYVLNNRKNATYWNSTRDTALCIEALADYLRASGETAPDMTVRLTLDGAVVKSEKITAENLFTFDNTFVIEGEKLAAGPHTLEVSRDGSGPLYYNAYLTNFTLEDHITKAGLELKVTRKIYRLTRDDRTTKAQGEHGQAVDKREERYARTELSEGQAVTSGDLVEVELTVDAKNDYEYILIEDMKAAGFEPVEVRSGYNGNDLNAYVEFRDERVAFFARMLGRGTHSVSYRLRAEVPGTFSALPAKGSAMYAPELRANSDEQKVKVNDR